MLLALVDEVVQLFLAYIIALVEELALGGLLIAFFELVSRELARGILLWLTYTNVLS